MNKTEIAKLLTLASGFDRRKVDEVTVEAWASVPDLTALTYDDAKQAVIEHQTGARRSEYMTIGHITDAVKVRLRLTAKTIAEDVRAARGYGLVESSWPESKVLPPMIREALFTVRDGHKRHALASGFDEELPGRPVDHGYTPKVPR